MRSQRRPVSGTLRLLLAVSLSLNLFPALAVGSPGPGQDGVIAPMDLPATLSVTEMTKIVADDGAVEDTFGYSVDLSGDTAVIGAERDGDLGVYSGSAYVYKRTGESWAREAKLTASDGSVGDYFGSAVAIDGDTIVVGAYQDNAGATACGSAYVFTRTGTVWTEQAKLVASDRGVGDYFGREGIDVSGDTAVVGSYNDDSARGSAYVFTRSGTAWTEQAKLTAPDRAASDYFGCAAALEGDTLVVGAEYDDDAATNGGAAYVFTRSGTAWSNEATLTASDPAPGDAFGSSVTISGTTVVIGAYIADDDFRTNCGAAYVFTGSGSTWTQQAKLMASDRTGSEYFGHSASLSGDAVVIGAFNDDVGSTQYCGSAYLFTRSGTEWTEQLHFTASDAGQNDYLGLSVALSGDTVIAGAYGDDDKGAEAGAAYVFDVAGNQAPVAADDPGLMTAVTKAMAEDGSAGDMFGQDVDISGDTAVVGSYVDDDAGAASGSAYVFVKSGGGWVQQAKLVAADATALSWFGNSVAIEGDTVVVGAPMTDSPEADAGAVYVFTRSGQTWTQQAKLLGDGAADSRFGYAVDLSGDTLVSGSGSDAGWSGAAYVFTGSGSSWTRQAKLTASDGQYADEMGNAAAVSGDVIVLGARGDDDAAYEAGAAYVFTRSEGVWTQADKLTASDGSAYAYLGDAVAVDGETVLVGCGQRNAVYVYTASGADWVERTSLVAEDASGADSFGYSVALDGTTALVGAYADSVNAEFSGSAYTFEGSGDTWVQTRKLSPDDGAWRDTFGFSVALDAGRAVVGAESADTAGGADAGAAYIYSEGAYETAEDEQLSVAVPGVLANDTDPEGAPLEATVVSGPDHGELSLEADGSFTYTPDADWSGEDSFTYTASDGLLPSDEAAVSIVVTPVNDPPVAVDDSYTVDENGTLIESAPGVLDNDTDVDGDAFESVPLSLPAHGDLSLAEDGSFTYTPDTDWSGEDSFTYAASDGTAYSDAGTVSITVTPADDDLVITPIEGADRYKTAVAASVAAYPGGLDPAGAKTVVIATGMNWPDALGGASLAGALDGPILLTPTSSIPSGVIAEITRLGATKAVIIGGDTAVSAGVESALRAKLGNGNVDRIAGSNRYVTANMVAARVISLAGGSFSGDAFIATGGNFPDSLAASPIAVAEKRPLYLVQPTATGAPSLPASVKRVAILGSSGAVNDAVEAGLKSKLGNSNVVRLGGKNRYETAVKIAEYGVSSAGLSWDGVAIATGANFPDALGGGVLQGKSGAVMLLSDPKSLSSATRIALVAHAGEIGEVRYFGSTAAVTQPVRDAIRAILE